jgi:serine beta-lactamase-like protein LACTB
MKSWWSCLLLALIQAPLCLAQPRIEPPAAHAAAVKQLERLIAHEVADKKLPALSIALVDDQTIIWAAGFGFADPKTRKPATAETVYRVGSVSKLFTDLAIMQQVEKGELDLDAPVSRYLPDFKPDNPFNKSITLRQLMTHRSGLVRESPVGHYFDPTTPALSETVASLNRTKLVYPPEERIKYSNAAIATVGRVLEVTQKKPFVEHLTKALLEPLGMNHSSFGPTPELQKELAKAVMWSYHGREFPAPTWELGMPPAGSMYTTVLDLARFQSVLFKGGEGPKGRILKPETIEAMYKPQFARKDEKSGFGIGFSVRQWQGKRRIGHGGAVYGFATDLSFLPDEKLGVIVVASRDVANAVTTHIADVALESMLAVKNKKPLPEIEMSEPLEPREAQQLAGKYTCGNKTLDIEEMNGRALAWMTPPGMRVELRKVGDTFVTDDLLSVGLKVHSEGDSLMIDKDIYKRQPVKQPAPAKESWKGLIGEYGWDHNVLYILEKDGKLHCLIEWIFLYPLEEEPGDIFKFPAGYGLYHGEKLIFKRNKEGKATQVEAASVVFERRKIDGEDGRTFRIQPRRPMADIRKDAFAATPPRFKGEFSKPDLVELTTLDPTIKLDIRYASTNNFAGEKFYEASKAYMQRPAAEAVVRVHKKLKAEGYGLLIHDGYRPWAVTKMFYEATPEQFRLFVADPSQGSRHNRGCAVDLTLYDLKTGKVVPMTGGYDEFSDRSYPAYPGGTSLQRWHRDVLRHAMEAEGFTVYEAEWWHFDYRDWKKYPVVHSAYAPFDAALLGKLSNR